MVVCNWPQRSGVLFLLSFFVLWILTSSFEPHEGSSHRVILTDSPNISSDLQNVFFFISPSWPSTWAGIISLRVGCVLLRAGSWWRSKTAGGVHDNTSSGSPPLLVIHGNQHFNTQVYTEALSCCCWWIYAFCEWYVKTRRTVTQVWRVQRPIKDH